MKRLPRPPKEVLTHLPKAYNDLKARDFGRWILLHTLGVPSIGQVAASLGIARKEARAFIRRLEAKGYVAVRKSSQKRGLKTYRLGVHLIRRAVLTSKDRIVKLSTTDLSEYETEVPSPRELTQGISVEGAFLLQDIGPLVCPDIDVERYLERFGIKRGEVRRGFAPLPKDFEIDTRWARMYGIESHVLLMDIRRALDLYCESRGIVPCSAPPSPEIDDVSEVYP